MERVGIFINETNAAEADRALLAKLSEQLKAEESFFVETFDTTDVKGVIEKAIQEQGLSGAVLASEDERHTGLCLQNGKGDEMERMPVIHMNLKERCFLPYEQTGEAALVARAKRTLQMAAELAANALPVRFEMREANRNVVVIGGNHAALNTALALSEQGLKTTLFMTPPPAGCFYPLPDASIQAIKETENIEIIENASLKSLNGSVGNFNGLAVGEDGKPFGFSAGAVVVSFDANLNPLDVSDSLQSDGLLSLRTFVEKANASDAKENAAVIWLDRTGAERRCASESAVEAATKFVEAGNKAYILFQHMPVYGRQGQKRYDKAREAGVQFIRYSTMPKVSLENETYHTSVVDMIVPDHEFTIDTDYLVIPASVSPRADNEKLAAILKQPLDDEGFLQPGNVRHMPVASARKGVFFTGGCTGDCDPVESKREADAVVAMVSSLLPEGQIVAPLEKVTVDVGLCASCLTCLRICPHGAIESYHDQKSVTFLSSACFECGLCAAACPGQAIEHGSLNLKQLAASSKLAGETINGKKPLVVFACRQGAMQAFEQAGRAGLQLPEQTIFIDVPCAGRVDEMVLLQTALMDVAGVLVLGCHPENCRSLKGSSVAARRIDRINQAFMEVGQSGDRIRYGFVAANEPNRLVNLLHGILNPPEAMASAAEPQS